jgi:hypothetical protein
VADLVTLIKERPAGRWIWDAGTAVGVLVAVLTSNVLWVVAGWFGGLVLVLGVAAVRAAVTTRAARRG